MTRYQASCFIALPLLLLLISTSSCERTEDVAPVEKAAVRDANDKNSGDSTFISYNIAGGRYIKFYHLTLFIYAKEDSNMTTPVYQSTVKGELEGIYTSSYPLNVLIPIHYSDCIYRYKIAVNYSLCACPHATMYDGPTVIKNSGTCIPYYKPGDAYLLDERTAVGFTDLDVTAGYASQVQPVNTGEQVAY